MKKPLYRSIIWVACLFLMVFTRLNTLSAQSNPICFGLSFPTVHAQAGDTVCLPLRVHDFNLIVSMQFSTLWDTSKLELLNLDYDLASELPGLQPTHLYYNPFQRYLAFSYDDITAMGQTLPDSAILFNLCFRVKEGATGFAAIAIDRNTHPKYEVVQMLPPDWHFVHMPYAQQSGGVQIDAGQNSSLSVSSFCVTQASCNGPQGNLSLEASGGVPPYQFAWKGPFGFTSTSANLSAINPGLYQFTLSDAQGAEVKGEVWMDGTPSSIKVSANIFPAVCGVANGRAVLQVSGGNPPYQFDWSEGNSITAESAELSPGPHSVTVNDQSGCATVYQFEVPNWDAPEVDIFHTDIYACGAQGELYANVIPFSTDYTYQWSNGSTDYAITHLPEGAYTVTVTSPGGCTTVQESQVNNWVTYLINTTLTPYCDPLNPTAGALWLSCAPANLLDFPVSVTWSNGSVHTIYTAPAAGAVFDTLQGVPSGPYTATISSFSGCTLETSATLECNTPLEAGAYPAFYIKDDYLTPQYAIDSCAGVYGRNLAGLRSMAFSLKYPTEQAEVKGVKNLHLPGLTTDDFHFDKNYNTITLDWSSTYPLNIVSDSLLFEVCFDVSGNIKAFDLEFNAWPQSPRLLNNYGQKLPFIGRHGYVMTGLYFPPGPSVCDFEIKAPDCASDNQYRMTLGSCNPNKTLNGFWSRSDFNGAGESGTEFDYLQFSKPGNYYIVAWQAASSESEFYAHLPALPAYDECVWPGDADNNNVVNHYDLLYLGIAYGAQGPARENASGEWTGQACSDWSYATHASKVNYKNIDTNGDGFVNASDTTLIVENWGKVMLPSRDDPFAAPPGTPIGTTFPLISVPSDTIVAGEVVNLPLSLGSASMPMDSIYGLAFSIQYDPKLISDDIRFSPSNSWLGNTSEYLCIQKIFPDSGRLDVAITRIDGKTVSGWGDIGDLFIIIEDDIFGDPSPVGPQDTTIKTNLAFHDIHSVNADAKPMGVDGIPAELVLQQRTSGLAFRPDAPDNISVMPNPASDEIFVKSAGEPLLKVALFDLTGRQVAEWFPDAPNARLPLDQAPEGACFLRIATKNGTSVRQIRVFHKN